LRGQVGQVGQRHLAETPLRDLQQGGQRQGCGQHGQRHLRRGGRRQPDLQRGKVGQAGQVLSSVNRIGRQLDGEWKKPIKAAK
jgi:hypothetical protein